MCARREGEPGPRRAGHSQAGKRRVAHPRDHLTAPYGRWADHFARRCARGLRPPRATRPLSDGSEPDRVSQLRQNLARIARSPQLTQQPTRAISRAQVPPQARPTARHCVEKTPLRSTGAACRQTRPAGGGPLMPKLWGATFYSRSPSQRGAASGSTRYSISFSSSSSSAVGGGGGGASSGSIRTLR